MVRCCSGTVTAGSTGVSSDLRVTVSMSAGDWSSTAVDVVSGADTTTNEACSASFGSQDSHLETTACLPVALVVKPASAPEAAPPAAEVTSGSASGSGSANRRVLADGSVSSESPALHCQ
jgi:hypothetical protein